MKRVLIIEDEKPLRDAFAFLLKSEGYEVELAENGQVGVEKLKTFKPDLILLDMLMPVMNGLEFLRVTHTKRKPPYKTLVLSNLSDPIVHEDIALFGVTHSMLKADLSPAQLAEIVKTLIAK